MIAWYTDSNTVYLKWLGWNSRRCVLETVSEGLQHGSKDNEDTGIIDEGYKYVISCNMKVEKGIFLN